MQPLQIGVCSWSLAIPDLTQALATVRDKLKLGLVQVGFFDDGYRDINKMVDLVTESRLEVSATCVGFAGEDYSSIQNIAASGGYIPNSLWEERRAKTIAVADITAKLGVKLLATHVGFVPHDRKDAQYLRLVDRLRDICDALGARGVTLVMETGQEQAEALIDFIEAVGCKNIGVNFDPANMILYGVGEPLEAVALLKERIIHVHMKDANWSAKPGRDWGAEVVLGTGQADIPRIVSKLRAQGYRGPLVIEREAGNQRLVDIQEAARLLESLVR
ncbi:MAG: sugar phosphate isomerase/epimerase [Phycisphaerae bacterium]|nr:sugar phosphate isomerase/epimerase [Phycisphaerae bacterium]